MRLEWTKAKNRRQKEGNKMKIEIMSKENLRYEIFSWLEDLKKNEKLSIEIAKCNVIKGSYDLQIRKEKK